MASVERRPTCWNQNSHGGRQHGPSRISAGQKQSLHQNAWVGMTLLCLTFRQNSIIVVSNVNFKSKDNMIYINQKKKKQTAVPAGRNEGTPIRSLRASHSKSVLPLFCTSTAPEATRTSGRYNHWPSLLAYIIMLNIGFNVGRNRVRKKGETQVFTQPWFCWRLHWIG